MGRLALEDDAARVRRRRSAWGGTSPVDASQALHADANRLGRAGRFDEALVELDRAIALRRELVDADADAHTGRLARSLHARSVWLAAAGRHGEALRSSIEAVAMLRGRAALRLEDAEADLARALNGFAAVLGGMGRPAEAVAPAAEAVALRRELAAEGRPRPRAELAGTLVGLAHALGAAGRHAEALPALDEAAAVYADLEAHDPSFRSAHAQAEDDLGVAATSLGRPAAALAHFERSALLLRFDEALPGAPRDRGRATQFAGTLRHLVDALRAADRVEDALEAAEERVAVNRAVVESVAPEAVPGELSTTAGPARGSRSALALAEALVAVAELRLVTGRRRDATAAAREAVGLAGESSSGPAADLRARAHGALADALAASGGDVEALRTAELALAEHRDAAQDAARDPVALARALHRLAGRLAAVGRCLEAVRTSDEAVATLRAATAERRPGSAELLTVVLGDHATRLGEAGRLGEALGPVDEAIARLRGVDALRADAGERLADALRIRSERLAALGREEEAGPAVDEALAVLRGRTIRRRPGAEVALAAALRQRGALLRRRGRGGEAELLEREADDLVREPADARR